MDDKNRDGDQSSLLAQGAKENKPAKTDEAPSEESFAGASGAVANKLTTPEMARSLVFKYAQKLLDKDRAQEFFTQLGFLMRKSPQLAKCTPESFFVAAMQCVNLDLMPGTPEQHCAIIPYGKDAQFQLMYQGGMELAYRSGNVKTIKADLVFAEDEFDFDDATNYIHHKKDLTIDRTVAKDIVAAYAAAKLENGEIAFVVLSPSEIKKVKDKSVKAKAPGTPWSDWEERMVRKTAIKRLLSDLPGSRKDNRFKAAVKWDSENEAGKRLKVDFETGQIIEGEVGGLPDDVVEAINGAQDNETLQGILDNLNVADRKKAAPLVADRIKDL